MKRLTLRGSVAVCFSLVLVGPLLGAESSATSTVTTSPGGENDSAATPAQKCLSDLRAFDDQMQKDGYWLGGYAGGDSGLDGSSYGYGYGYGYPVGGYGYGLGSYPADTDAGYFNARPGYEVRMLVASANVLARHGQQQPCEDVLATARDIYKQYVADMMSAGMPMADVPGWQQQQLAAAEPVTNTTISLRSDQLLGTDVRNAQYEALGSVDDLVLSPGTGKIAYLVIARGGIFGIGGEYIPVPWEAFKVTQNATLLVLDATTSTMDAAPQVSSDEFTTLGQQSQKVDAYWKALISSKGSN